MFTDMNMFASWMASKIKVDVEVKKCMILGGVQFTVLMNFSVYYKVISVTPISFIRKISNVGI